MKKSNPRKSSREKWSRKCWACTRKYLVPILFLSRTLISKPWLSASDGYVLQSSRATAPNHPPPINPYCQQNATDGLFLFSFELQRTKMPFFWRMLVIIVCKQHQFIYTESMTRLQSYLSHILSWQFAYHRDHCYVCFTASLNQTNWMKCLWLCISRQLQLMIKFWFLKSV